MEDENLRKHTLGICAMKKKIHSPHMQQILEFISNFNDFELIEFTEDIIFNEEVEKWPKVESMIVFFSTGFPYSKVLKYINLRKPFLPNNFEMQKIFWDRIKVMTMLKENNIPIPNEIIVEREEEINNEDDDNCIELNTSQEIEEMIEKYYEEYDEENKPKAPPLMENVSESNKSDETNSNKLDVKETIITKNEKGEEIINELEEYDEYIVYNGKKIMKPFVEKPRNGDDHNIYIYYPMSHGGGQTRLFRKTRDLSSLYYPNINKIRRDKSYIYEEYLQTDGFDIKVYTVGEKYAHAEARKSPSLDGIVERSKGKEVRYPVNLNPEEKEIARKIVKIFKQNICGFDILRSKGVSYVCDVNGWSFVKGNKKYFQDCAFLLRKIILSNIDPNLLIKHPIKLQYAPVYKEMILRNKSEKIEEELHSVVAVFRHADRSPKQKLKLVVEHPALLELFEIFKENIINDDKGKDKIEPQELKLKKPNELMTVLNIVKDILYEKGIKGDELTLKSDNFDIKIFQIKLILEKNLNFEGLTRKIQMRPLEYKYTEDKFTKKKKLIVTKALMIMKWGGHITHSGIEQAKLLGNTFRYQFYPPGKNDKGDGLLRLHNTYRHDLKCYSSEEGRCLKSAAAFLQGLLQLEGNLIPIITSMVWNDEQINKLLDVNCTSCDLNRREAKKNLNDFCNYDGKLKEKYINFINKEKRKEQEPFIQLTENIGNFHNKMVFVHQLLECIVNQLSTKLDSEEKEKEYHTYFIKSKISVMARYDSDTCENLIETKMKKSEDKILKKHSELKLKKMGTEKEEIKKETKIDKYNNSNNKINEKENNSNDSNNSLSEIIQKKSKKSKKSKKKKKMYDCEEEKVVLIYKRYWKLFNDFYDEKKQKFDISKIPDIYDNIKYDLIHNKQIIGKTAYELYKTIDNLADFVMPLEYGIKIEDKIKIGITFIKPLLTKIYNDLLWLNRIKFGEKLGKKTSVQSILDITNMLNNINLESLESKERTYFGLDAEKLDKSEIKSVWRHIKTRFYFTSQSHLYSLLNTLIYSMNSFLVDNGKSINPIWKVFDLDYCSHIVFRLFENFNVDKKSNERFRIEIIVSAGADKDLDKVDNTHMVSMNPWIILNDHLTLADFKKYINFILNY